MAGEDKARALALAGFEENAEVFVTYQLDLLAHLERQLRAAHRLMRNIEKLRNVSRRRAGPELSNGERGDALAHLDAELDDIDAQVRIQRQLSVDMHATVDQMQAKLNNSVRSARSSVQHRRSQRIGPAAFYTTADAICRRLDAPVAERYLGMLYPPTVVHASHLK